MCNCIAVHTSAALDAPNGNEKHDDQTGSNRDECTSSNYVATREVHWLGSGFSHPVHSKSNVWATYTEWAPQSTYTPAVDRHVT